MNVFNMTWLWLWAALILSVIVGCVSYVNTDDIVKYIGTKYIIYASATIFTVNAFFSLNVTTHLNRMTDIFYEVHGRDGCEETRKDVKKKILVGYFVAYLAHFAFTLGIISTAVLGVFWQSPEAIKCGIAFFSAGYTALIVSSVQMFVGACGRLTRHKLSI